MLCVESGVMIETTKTIILDFQEAELNTGTLRHLKIESIPGKASVCIGVRRSGKSTCLFQIIQRLIDSGVSRQNILYVNFFDDRLHELQHGGGGIVSEAYFALYPEKKNSEMVYCFFDEIQMVAGWEPFIDRMMRTELCEVYITGSSARMLSKEIATQMRGRALSWELFPFSFNEFLDSRSFSIKKPFSTKSRLLTQKYFEEYWESGGFPEVIGVTRFMRTKIHQEYYGAILFRDLVERHDVSHPQAVSDLAHWLVDNIASLYTVNSLTGYLKSRGHKVPKSKVTEYLEWFEDAYFLFTVRLFDTSLSRSNANAKKIYCIDHALVRSVSSGILLNSGHLLENLVFIALRRIYPTIYYYRTKCGKEVDFVVQLSDCTRLLVQVCESMADLLTRKREVGALHEAMVECGAKSGIIVTRSEEERIVVDTGEITVMPAWKFLFDLPDS